MRRLFFWLALAASLTTLSVAQAGESSGEPFGVELQGSPSWLLKLQAKYRGLEAAEIRRIADEVKKEERVGWLSWINQKVQLSPAISTTNSCTERAVAKCEVAKILGLDCRV